MTIELSVKKVQRGDCAWTVAKKNLKAKNKRAKNIDIVNEIKRLADINGCKDVNEFNQKYFSRGLGKEVVLGIQEIHSNETAVPEDTTATPHIENTKQKKATLPAKPEKANKIDSINNMINDDEKIIEYNKKNYNGDYYGIVDKKKCKLNIYNTQGQVVKSFTIGVGKTKGDNVGSYFLEHAEKTKDAYKAETQRYTTAGEFTLDEYKTQKDAYKGKDGKTKIMALRGDNMGVRGGQMCIHMCYKPEYRQRAKKIKSKTLADNRMSYGCVNLLEEDYDKMHKYLGEGDKIYVLPEERGNKLKLNKQKDGTYKFEQIYHKNDLRGKTKEEASNVNYDVRPERNPENIV